MEATVTWEKDLIFRGIADSGYPVKLDSESSSETGVGPVELVAMALAGCTAMDVISILNKIHEQVTSFDVKIKAERATDYPKVISHAALEYEVVGKNIAEEAVLRAIDLSVKKYCPVHAMLEKAFPIDLHYSIYEDEGDGKKKLVKQGTHHLQL
jgi:putative redox protein